MTIAIVLMVIVWLAALIGRNHIRAQWWAYRLTHVEDPDTRSEYFQRLVLVGDAAVPAARNMLRSEDAGVRSFAVAVLNHTSDSLSRPLLMEAIDDPDAEVRRTAILGLSRRGPAPELVKRLVRMMQSQDAERARQAIIGLAAIGSPDATAAMIDALKPCNHVAVRAQAMESLAEAGATEAIDALIECLADDTAYAGLTESERFAREALKRIAGGSLGEGTFAAKRTIGDRAAYALGIICGQSFDYQSGDPESKSRAIAAWQTWRDREERP